MEGYRTDSVYWIWAASALGYGIRRGMEVLEQFPDPEELYRLSPAALEAALGQRTAAALLRHSLDDARRTQEEALGLGCTILTPDSPDYPEGLRNIHGYPMVLYLRGSLSEPGGFAGLSQRLCLAMVGSRKMSEYGQRVGDKLSRELASAGAVIVSGLAAGVDKVCHTGAIKAEGTTVGVLGCGIDSDYPRGSGPFRELVERHGAVLTEYPPGTPPIPRNFPVRNRIISGLCQGLVVIEAGERSGTLVTVGHAVTQNRDVFVVPGRIDDPGAQGCNKLLLQGAKPVTRAEDVLEDYRSLFDLGSVQAAPSAPAPVPGLPTDLPRRKRAAPDYLSPEQNRVYKLLDFTPMTADAIADALNLPITKVLSTLTELEIYGLAAAGGGRTFTAEF